MIKIELEIRHHQGEPDIFCPIFVCDHCGQKIENAEEGMYHYRDDEKGTPLDESIKLYHKRPCSYQAEMEERKQGRKGFPWNELRDLIGYLVNNSGLKWHKLISEYCDDEDLKAIKQVLRGK